MNAREKLAELDREFERPNSRVTGPEYRRRVEELSHLARLEKRLERENEERARATAPANSESPDSFLQVLAGAFKPIVFRLSQHIGAAGRRIDALEKRIAALEARPAMSYAGTWRPGLSEGGQFYTDRGSMFYCRVETSARPGESDDWILCVKRGKDGRDAKGGAA